MRGFVIIKRHISCMESGYFKNVYFWGRKCVKPDVITLPQFPLSLLCVSRNSCLRNLHH